jgi:hypothetical protein
LRAVLEATLRPELIAFLQENLLPLHAGLLESCQRNQRLCHDELVAKISAHYRGFSADIEAMKTFLSNPIFIRTQVRAALTDQDLSMHMSSTPKSSPAIIQDRDERETQSDESHEAYHCISTNTDDKQASKREVMEHIQESLHEV